MAHNLPVMKQACGQLLSSEQLSTFDCLDPKIKSAYEELSLSKQIFIAEYLSNGMNGTQAAIKIGYAEKLARMAACKMLRDKQIADFIKLIIGNALDRAEIGADWVIDKIKTIIRKAEEGDTNRFGDYDAKVLLSALDMICKIGGFYEIQSESSNEKKDSTIDSDFVSSLTRQLNQIVLKNC